MKTPVMSEADLAARVVKWLEANGHEVFQEVEGKKLSYADCGRADIVALRGGLVTVVETKMSLGFDVLAQAEKWIPFAHEVLVAVPAVHQSKNSDGRRLAYRVVEKLRLGLLEVRSLWPIEEGREEAVRVRVEAERNSDPRPDLRLALRDEHKTYAKAGTNKGGHFTDFRKTCNALAEVARESPGIPLKEALAKVPHHYTSIASGVQALAKWCDKGLITGFEIRSDGERLTLHPRGEAANA